uniref:T-complex protein 1 subunit epsilon n=1 Tax=Dermatophagoides pteronyssinus TaxID=6956 RepID=A0A6P6YJG3_DERPT|nr:T-complex protein 1 subunit epsilon-like [Dermatophagoides pteronyssinus]
MNPSGHFGGLAEIGGAPIIIVEGEQNKSRLTGLEARKANIQACLDVANMIKTSFGPRGLDKIITTKDGDLVVSNDGAIILKHLPISHECAKLFVDLSRSQDMQIGDGTTGIVILAGALLEQALELLDMKIHPIKIADGFDFAATVAIDWLHAHHAAVELASETQLLQVAKTSLCSKIISAKADLFADMCVRAVLGVADVARRDCCLDLISVECKPGGSLEESLMVNGIALDKEFSHSQMPKTVNDARIALLCCPFEPPKPKTKHKLEISSAAAYDALAEQEAAYFSNMVQRVAESGATVVICQWGFDDEANHLLLKAGIPAVRWVSGKELEMISLATGAQLVARFEDLSAERLGRAQTVREVSVGTEDQRMVLIEGCPTQKAVSILICGSNRSVADEAKRSVHDAICTVRNLVVNPAVVPGGCASEIACSLAVSAAVPSQVSHRQFAVQAFADALLKLPQQLAANAGFQGFQVATAARAAQLQLQDSSIGIDCSSGEPRSMSAAGVFESLDSKVHQILLATQIVKMVLRIDDVIECDKSQQLR